MSKKRNIRYSDAGREKTGGAKAVKRQLPRHSEAGRDLMAENNRKARKTVAVHKVTHAAPAAEDIDEAPPPRRAPSLPKLKFLEKKRIGGELI